MSRSMRTTCFSCLLVLLTSSAPAGAENALDRTQTLEQGKAFGQAGIGQIENAARQPPSDQIVPAYRGSDPPQIDLYQQGLGIEDTAREQLPASEAGDFVHDSSVTRPQFTLQPDTDPLLLEGQRIQTEADDWIGTLSNSYGACTAETRHYTQAPFSEQSCTEWGTTQRSCERELEVHCTRPALCAADGNGAQGLDLSTLQTDTAFSYRYPVLTWGRAELESWVSNDCAIYTRRASFEIEDLERIADFRLLEIFWDDHIQLSLNGRQVFIGPGAGSGFRLNTRHCIGRGCGALRNRIEYFGGGQQRCELGTDWHRQTNIDLRPYLRPGTNRLRMRLAVQGSGESFMRFSATQYCGCAEGTDQWSDSCAAQPVQSGHCALAQTECTDSAPRHSLGDSLQRPCWRERRTYQCLSDEEFVEEGYCAELRRRGCEQTGSVCVQHSAQGACLEYEQGYRCPQQPHASFTRMNCGEQSHCLNGDCFESGWQASDDFPQAASYLSMIEQAATDLDADTFEIFQGADLRCKKRVLGLANCCSDSGWGLDIGLFQCSEPERLLAEQRRAGRCHYVGSYSSGSLLTRKRVKSFCCFRSSLGRIVQQQGRPQLDLDWGAASAPDCRGLLPEELADLDFERIDLSEFYASSLEQADAAQRPDDAELRRRVAERLQNLQP